MKLDETRIEKLMSTLNCSRDEAIEIIKEDEEIDGMSMKEVNADLTEEQKKAVKAATKTGTKKRTAVKRERKVDPVKKQLINNVRILLEGMHANVEPLTNETDLHFTYEGASYSIKLTKHRPPKK
jgi:hypothetical protein